MVSIPLPLPERGPSRVAGVVAEQTLSRESGCRDERQLRRIPSLARIMRLSAMSCQPASEWDENRTPPGRRVRPRYADQPRRAPGNVSGLQIRRRAEALYQRDGTGVSGAAFKPRLLAWNQRDDPLHDAQYRVRNS